MTGPTAGAGTRAGAGAGTRAGAGAALELAGVSRSFGSLRAVDEVSFDVRPGARHAVIGPNGAGKSTLFNLIGGSLRATAGAIRFDGQDVTATPEHRRARLGLARTFQHSAVFLRESAVENVLVGVARKAGVGGSLTRAALRRRTLVDRCVALLDQVGLDGRYDVPAGNLSHGERRQLEIAMALGTEPRLLLLDEPAAGMSAAETARFTALIAALPREVTVLLIEHDLDVVFELADTVTVLHLGRHLTTGTPPEVRADPAVQEAYLGAADADDLFGDGAAARDALAEPPGPAASETPHETRRAEGTGGSGAATTKGGR